MKKQTDQRESEKRNNEDVTIRDVSIHGKHVYQPLQRPEASSRLRVLKRKKQMSKSLPETLGRAQSPEFSRSNQSPKILESKELMVTLNLSIIVMM